jgi:hypothetical protein
MKLAHWGLAILIAAPAGLALARQQTDQQTGQQDVSLAAAARRAREEKKQQAKSPKVWTNENVPKNPGSVSVVGQLELTSAAPNPDDAASSDKKPTAPATPAAKTTSTADKKASIEEQLLAAKETLQTLQNDFDILQRKFTLDQQTYLGKPDYASDKAGGAALKDEQDQLDAKQQEMMDAQTKIADLQAQLNTLNTDAAAPASTDAKSPAK